MSLSEEQVKIQEKHNYRNNVDYVIKALYGYHFSLEESNIALGL